MAWTARSLSEDYWHVINVLPWWFESVRACDVLSGSFDRELSCVGRICVSTACWAERCFERGVHGVVVVVAKGKPVGGASHRSMPCTQQQQNG